MLISNIPPAFHSADLRHFFGDMVDSGRFVVFQPSHRVDDVDHSAMTSRAQQRVRADPQATEQALPAIFPSRTHMQLALLLHDQGQPVSVQDAIDAFTRRYGRSSASTTVHTDLDLTNIINDTPQLFTRVTRVVRHKLASLVQLTTEGDAAVATMMASKSDPADSAAVASAAAEDGSRKRRFDAMSKTATSTTANTRPTWKCMVQVRTRGDVSRLLRDYDQREWRTRKGEHTGLQCRIRSIPLPPHMLTKNSPSHPSHAYPPLSQGAGTATAIDLTVEDRIDLTDEAEAEEPPAGNGDTSKQDRETTAPPADSFCHASFERELLAAVAAGEFQTPPYLPNGLVGTPTATIHANIAHLPTSLLHRLHVRPVAQVVMNHPFRYTYADSSDSRRTRTEEAVGDSPERPYLQQAADDDAQEEWDRDLDLGVRSTAFDSGRGLGKVGDGIRYEEEVERTWDKGDGSGLVTFTDDQHHDANRGDFDERTTDAWDVDNDDDDEPLEEDSEEERLRAVSRDRRAEIMRERSAAADVVLHEDRRLAQQAASAACDAASTAWTRTSFLSNMMSRMGYVPGQGLGKQNQGIAHAIQPVQRGDKVGLGFATTRTGDRKTGSGTTSARQQRRREHAARHKQPRDSQRAPARPGRVLASMARADFSSRDS